MLGLVMIMVGKIRMRPILMTTLSTIVRMMPIALASGTGAEWKSGLAYVLIGGLTSSMLLTLIVVPCVYLIFDVWGKTNLQQRSETYYFRIRRARKHASDDG